MLSTSKSTKKEGKSEIVNKPPKHGEESPKAELKLQALILLYYFFLLGNQ